ncbi:MmgE/PrpD family protein [bacterium]|nr:MmgE/PrpD family protein [bacterium]
MEETRRLARFVSELTYESLPEGVIEKTKDLILDQLGCQLAGSTMSWSKAAYEFVADYKGPREESTVVNYGLKTTAQDAAFANASFGNAFLGDDTDSVCHAHLGAIIIPAALAMGEREGIDGREFIKAIVAGYEVASRVGAAASSAEGRGYHPGPLFGPFGVAACAGNILGFNEDQISDALGIAGSHASGLMEYSRSGGSVNRVHAGIATYGGIRAALLAQRGFSGPATILEGERGFVKAFSGECAFEEMTRGLGRQFRVQLIDLKAHCCCGTSGANLDAVSKMMSQYDINPKKIREIIVKVTPPTYRMTGAVVRPKDITSAQFGGRFGIALRLLKGGNSFREYTEENLKDPDILDLEAKTDIILDEALEEIPESDHPAKVTIKLADGSTYEETVYAAKGSILNPMTKDEVDEKFRGFASVVVPDHITEAIIEKVARLDTVDDIREVSQLLVTGVAV